MLFLALICLRSISACLVNDISIKVYVDDTPSREACRKDMLPERRNKQ